MPRFDDGDIGMQELRRHLAEQVVNAVMDAEADQLCGDNELGYFPLDADGARPLFQDIAGAYEGQSVATTTNLEFSRWGSVFGDDQMAAAVIDRIVYHGRHHRQPPQPRPSCPTARTRPPGPPARVAVTPGSARLTLVQCVPLVEPLVESLPRGVPRLAGRAHDGPSAFLDRLDGLALFLFRVARYLRTPNRTGSVQLFVRAPISAIKQCIHTAT